jgi:hypothetical protein
VAGGEIKTRVLFLLALPSNLSILFFLIFFFFFLFLIISFLFFISFPSFPFFLKKKTVRGAVAKPCLPH